MLKLTKVMMSNAQIPAAGPNFIQPLVTLVLKQEQALMVEAGSPFHAPLVRFLARHPVQTLDFLLGEAHVQDEQCNRFLEVSCQCVFLTLGQKLGQFLAFLELMRKLGGATCPLLRFWLGQNVTIGGATWHNAPGSYCWMLILFVAWVIPSAVNEPRKRMTLEDQSVPEQ